MKFQAAFLKFETWDDPIYISRRPGVVNLQLNLKYPAYAFDSVGRLIHVFDGHKNYLRSLDNRYLSKWRQNGKRIEWISREEAIPIVLESYGIASRALESLSSEKFEVLPAPKSSPDSIPYLLEGLRTVSAWSWERLEEDAKRFRQVYKPVSILPPDQYMALVLQATEGCWYNKCTFCTFYRDRRFRIKTPEEFEKHILQVKEFFGSAIVLRKSLFLADANALMVSYRTLVSLLDVVHRHFEVMPATLTREERIRWRTEHPGGLHGIYSFIDAFTTGRKTPDEWRDIARRGVKRAYIGMESGHAPLLEFLRKPGTPEDILNAVHELKEAGIAVGVIILIGAGGDRFYDGHVKDTVELLNSMPLDHEDLIYFSRFVPLHGAPYIEIAREAGVRPLSAEEMSRQEDEIRSRFVPRNPNDRPKFSVYDIREFIY